MLSLHPINTYPFRNLFFFVIFPFLFVVFAFLFLCSRWSFVNVPLIFWQFFYVPGQRFWSLIIGGGAKTVKFCENPFLYAEEGCTLCYVGVLILSTLSPISKRIFFALVHLCVFEVNDRRNSYFWRLLQIQVVSNHAAFFSRESRDREAHTQGSVPLVLSPRRCSVRCSAFSLQPNVVFFGATRSFSTSGAKKYYVGLEAEG